MSLNTVAQAFRACISFGVNGTLPTRPTLHMLQLAGLYAATGMLMQEN